MRHARGLLRLVNGDVLVCSDGAGSLVLHETARATCAGSNGIRVDRHALRCLHFRNHSRWRASADRTATGLVKGVGGRFVRGTADTACPGEGGALEPSGFTDSKVRDSGKPTLHRLSASNLFPHDRLLRQVVLVPDHVGKDLVVHFVPQVQDLSAG